MFTGLVEQMGEVRRAGTRLAVATPLATELERGDSIAVNGVCLTAVAIEDGSFEADVMEETLARSNLRDLAPGAHVNLELPLRVGDRLGGHFVQGHVDGLGSIAEIQQLPHSRKVWIRAVNRDLMRYVVEKGSIAVDGVSLTVAELDPDDEPVFAVSLIPETLERTTLGSAREGDFVNLEADMLAKYAVKT